MIQLIDLKKTYNTGKNEVNAIRGINLEIPDNTFISICGKSGSGKTTLLNMISGVDKPTEGQVLIDGVDINRLSDKKMSELRNSKIGFVFQSFLLEPSLTALENVELPLIVKKIPREERERIAVEMLEKVGLVDRISHKPDELSGGEKQRVSIARALAIQPHILVADEPTGNLDEATGMQIMELIRECTKDCTLILVTHDNTLAAGADIKITLKDGMIYRYD